MRPRGVAHRRRCVRVGSVATLFGAISHDVHFEIERVCVLGAGGSGIAASDALGYIQDSAVGIDMIRRNPEGMDEIEVA